MTNNGWRATLESMDRHGAALEKETFKVLLILGILGIAATNYTVFAIIPFVGFITYLLAALPIAILTKYEGEIPFIRAFPVHFYIYIYEYIDMIHKKIGGTL